MLLPVWSKSGTPTQQPQGHKKEQEVELLEEKMVLITIIVNDF